MGILHGRAPDPPPHRLRGGYTSSTPVEDVASPPPGPAPGGKPLRNEYTIIVNENPTKSAIYLNGSRLPHVTHVTVDASALDTPKATIELCIQKLEFIGKDVEFDGLEEVPSEALIAELRKREQDA